MRLEFKNWIENQALAPTAIASPTQIWKNGDDTVDNRKDMAFAASQRAYFDAKKRFKDKNFARGDTWVYQDVPPDMLPKQLSPGRLGIVKDKLKSFVGVKPKPRHDYQDSSPVNDPQHVLFGDDDWVDPYAATNLAAPRKSTHKSRGSVTQ